MNDTVHVVQVHKSVEHRFGYLANHLNRDRAVLAVDIVERPDRQSRIKQASVRTWDSPCIHVLHDDPYVHIFRIAAIIPDDVRRRAVVHDLQLPQDLLTHSRLRVDNDKLTISAGFSPSSG